jgi:hypothetical protein
MANLTTPVAISHLGTKREHCQKLENIAVWPEKPSALYNEEWLQKLIDRHPEMLPIADVEPSLQGAVSVCRELSVDSGFIDNLLITPSGGIVVIETKLWRNPEARRAVVAQILDYASDLAGLDYEIFQQKIGQARGELAFSLFKKIGEASNSLSEARFVDAVSRNLRLGRMLLLVVGDGIREGVSRLSDYLQRHVGLHFTLGLVELALWRNASDGTVFVQPRVVAQTVQIERAVIRVEGNEGCPKARVEPTAETVSKPTSLSFEVFLEQQAADDPKLPRVLRPFIERTKLLGITADMQSSGLHFNWKSPEGRTFNLGVVHRDGCFYTSWVGRGAKLIGRLDLATRYQRDLVRRLPGTHLHETPKGQNNWIAWREGDEDWGPLPSWVLDAKSDVLSAMKRYINALARAEQAKP